MVTIHIFVVTTTFWGISSIQEQLKYSISTRERYMRLGKALNIGSSSSTLSRYSLVTDGIYIRMKAQPYLCKISCHPYNYIFFDDNL